MPGPPPKHPSKRRRRNTEGSSTRTLIDTTPARTRTPTLPAASSMLKSTRAWWKTVWASPMAAVWTDADVPALVRLAQLHDLTQRQFDIVRDGPLAQITSERITRALPGDELEESIEVKIIFRSPVNAAQLGEMRQLEDRLGLSPLSRRRLQWELERADQAAGVEEPPEDEVALRRQERYARALEGG